MSKFWDKQPVNRDYQDNPESIINLDQDQYRTTTLPDKFHWIDLEPSDPRVYRFLKKHYKEPSDAFSLHYSSNLIQWFFSNPFQIKNYGYSFGIEIENNGKRYLIGFIGGRPIKLNFGDKTVQTIEVNFLCIHGKYRNKRLAPILIKEIIRRGDLDGLMDGAIFTARNLPFNSLTTLTFYHRFLNLNKCIQTRFYVPDNPTVKTRVLKKLYQTRADSEYRLINQSDYPIIFELYQKQQYSVRYHFESVQEFKTFFDNRDIHILCLLDSCLIIDFVIYYDLPYIVQDSQDTIKTAYILYMTSLNSVKTLNTLFDFLKNDGYDVLNTFDQFGLDNKILDKTKCLKGNLSLDLYCFNYQYPKINPLEIGFNII